MSHLFNRFTNLYSLSKTLRFELKPVGETQKMLEDAKIFEIDKVRKEKYEATKPYFDRLHREFVEKALENAEISNLSGYFEIFKKWKKDKKAHEKELQNKEKTLRKEVVSLFDAQAKSWTEKYPGLKKKDIGILDEEGVFEQILKVRYGSEDESFLREADGNFILDDEGEKISIFDEWKGFTGYFKKFFETRKNFYKSDGTSTALATRIIDQNLKRFCDNMENFEKIKKKIDFSEVEKDFGESMNEVFSVSFYNSCLLQEGIDFYNKVLGGETLKNGEKLKGLNELINKYRQDHKGEKIPFFKLLDKQILSEKEKFIDEIERDDQLLEVLKDFYQSAEQRTKVLKALFKDLVSHEKNYDLSQVYLSKEALNTISHKWTGETELFEGQLYEVLRKSKEDSVKPKKKDRGYSFPDFIPLCYIQEALQKISAKKFWKERYYNEISGFSEENIWKQFLAILDFEFSSLFKRKVTNSETGEVMQLGYDVFKNDFKPLLQNFKNDQKAKVIIKNFADEVLRIYQMAKYFALEKKRKWERKWVGDDHKPGNFYDDPDFGFKINFYDNAYEEIVQPYNKLRNYVTKKPYSEEKWKLNFENPTLADGWDKNKESDNSAVILKKGEKYFLGLMAKGYNKIFDDRFSEEFSENITQEKYEKMNYKLLPGANKMLPKVFFGKSNIDFYNPSEKVLEIRNHSSHTKSGAPQKGFEKKEFNLNDCHILIDFFKKSIAKHPDWKVFDFHFSETSKYSDISDFYREVEEGGYKISFQDISGAYINQKNEAGELYLFQIKNKDWNEGSTGRKNLHTLYFESLFSKENIQQNFPFKLNGQAEIFYRPKTDVQKLGTKKDKRGKEVINHKRYNENKIFFHVPLTLNRTQGDARQFNSKINQFLANNPQINIIGVDRGEKHLAYYSVINQKGGILDSGSLNKITGVNYAEKLEEKAKSREQARKDWQTVEGIKDLKKGYISQVVRKLADLAIEHNAIIVFEDLNMRFKQIRGGIEKSVYQQLEKALIEKLNFLVNKGEKDPNQAGHLLKAYQLAAPFTTFKEMGKQTGILFYTQAAYTSKIDPITGWRPHLYLKYASAEKAKKDIDKFSKIEFKQGRFEFTYDIKKFRELKKSPKNTIWTVCSNVERFRWNRHLNNNKGDYDHFKGVTDKLMKLFNEYKIDFQRGDILGQVDSLETKGNEKFFKDFIFLFNLICQIRNTDDSEKAKREGKDDFILSPVEPFFDSRKENGANLPKNGDDNGAYNIARKGVILLNKLSEHLKKDPDFKKYPELYISNTEWDDFARK